MPSGRTKGRRRKRNKSSPLVENSPKKPKSLISQNSHKSHIDSDITNDISIKESDHEAAANQGSDTDTLFTPQSQSLFDVFETPATSESDQNQNSLLVKRQTDNTTPGGMGLDRRGLVPSSHKRSKFRHTII